MSSGFGLMGAIFPIMFLVVLGVFVAIAVRGISTWNKNNHSPKMRLWARVVAKRMAVHHGGHAGNMHHHMGHTSYFITFEFDTGDRQELSIPYGEYGYIVEGDEGTLSLQGTRFLGFERQTAR
jgi:hypothetical protein